MDELLRPLRVVDENHFARSRAEALAAVRKKRTRLWRWPLAAVAAAVFALVLVRPVMDLELPPAPPRPPAPDVAQVPQPAVNAWRETAPRRRLTRPTRERVEEPIVVRFYTEDPDVVIIWLGD